MDGGAEAWRDEILVRWRTLLAEVSASGPDYEAIRCVVAEDDEGMTFDANLGARARCLWALQYETDELDSPHLRQFRVELLREEIAWHRAAPFQGLSPELELASLLVARSPEGGGLDLLWEAKRANFDTWCGSDSRLLGAGGVQAAIDRAEDEDLLELLLDGDGWRVTDTDVAAALETAARRFPADPAEDSHEVWFDRLANLGDVAAAVVLQAWRDSSTPPDDGELQFALASIGRHGEAADAQERALEQRGGAAADFYGALRLAELRRVAGQFDEALAAVEGAATVVAEASDPTGYQRRCVANEAFLIAASAGGPLARRAFDLGHAHARRRRLFRPEPLPLVVLEAAHAAAGAVGEGRAERSYRARAAKERARIARELQG